MLGQYTRAWRSALTYVVAALVLAGCATVSTYYKDLLPEMPKATKDRLILEPCEPRVYQYSSDRTSDEYSLHENGYEMIGYSSFNGPTVDNGEIITQAKAINAQVAMVASRYTGTTSGSIPFTTYTQQQSTSRVTGDINATIRTTGPSVANTTYIPYSVQRYDYLITFWTQSKMPSLGVRWSDLPVALRQQLERNKGLLVQLVRKGSPAFDGGVIPGDVLIGVNDTEISSSQDATELLSRLAGTEVTLNIIRSGRTVDVVVKLNPLP